MSELRNEHMDFLGAFVRSPITTGALLPSSLALARAMIEGMDLADARTVVEVGPGTGSFTGTILEAVHDDALVMAVEINGDFAAHLRVRHPRLQVVHDSVERLPAHLAAAGRDHADVVVCGVPWAILDAESQRCLLGAISATLKPGGRFATFSYLHCKPLPWSQRFRNLLRSEFADVQISPAVWRNVPPAFVYRCRK